MKCNICSIILVNIIMVVLPLQTLAYNAVPETSRNQFQGDSGFFDGIMEQKLAELNISVPLW